MNLSQLYYFKKLAEVQHYTKAAKELFITQPSLSDSIAALEKELGVSLFQKKGRGIELTKYGKEFNEYVKEALGILEHGIASIKEQADDSCGVIDIGCIPTLLNDFLPNTLEHYTAKTPLVQFNIYHGMSLQIAQGVDSGAYDLGFCSMVENQPNLVFVPIMYQELIVIVNNCHPLASKNTICLSDLRDYKVITYRDTLPIGKTIKKLLADNSITAAFSYDDELSIAGQVTHGSKAAIVANTSFLKQFDNLCRISLSDVAPDTRLIYMVYSSKNFKTSAVERFANYVIAHEMKLP